MKYTITKFSLLTLSLMLVGIGFGQSRYVSNSGNDAGSNDCSNVSNPCLTIEKAATQALSGDSIIVAPGNYEVTATVDLTKSDITLIAETFSDKPVITSTASDIIKVSASHITISNLIFKMGLTDATGKRGIVGTGGFGDLLLSGNEFYSTNPGGFFSTGMVFGSYAVLLHAPSTTPINVVIDNNTIGMEETNNDAFGRGLGIGFNASGTNGPGGVISNNNIAAYYPVQSIGSGADLTLSNNHLMGMSMFNSPRNGATITLTNNTFDGVADQYASNIFTLLDVRAINNGNVIISDNVFLNFYTTGLFSMASKNVSVLNNMFTPSETADQFISLVANTKLMTSGIQSTSYSDEITIKGNTFNPGIPDKGTAIVFADHYGANTPAFATTIVGGPSAAEKNVFNTDLGHYIQLDSLSGSSDQVTLWNPSGFGGEHTPATIMQPVTQDVIALAANNDYGFTTVQDIEDKNIDSIDVVGLGKIILGYVSPAGLTENVISSAEIYPNPATENLNIVLNDGLDANIQINDVLGNVVYNGSIHSMKSIDVSGLQNGVYFVKITADNQYTTKKFIKE